MQWSQLDGNGCSNQSLLIQKSCGSGGCNKNRCCKASCKDFKSCPIGKHVNKSKSCTGSNQSSCNQGLCCTPYTNCKNWGTYNSCPPDQTINKSKSCRGTDCKASKCCDSKTGPA